MEKFSSLLISKKDTVMFKRSLALLIGLNESIVLQQIYYWLEKKEEKGEHFYDGRYWVYNSYDGWKEQFPFWSIMTIRRAFSSLEKQRVVIVGNYNKAGFDKTKWYSIDFDVLNNMNLSSVQNEQTISSKRTDGSVQNEQPNTKDYTETTTKITSKTTLHSSQQDCEGLELHSFTSKESESAPPEPHKQFGKFDWEIFRSRIDKACVENGYDDENSRQAAQHIFTYYYRHRKLYKELEPQMLNQQSINKAVANLFHQSTLLDEYGIDIGVYEDMVNLHFQTAYNIDNMDWSICHFLSGNICDNLFYKINQK